MISIKEEIINKSFYQFVNRGFKACSLKHLEQATGFTKGALYYYFKNKEEILKAGIEKYLSIFTLVPEKDFSKINSLREYISKMIERKAQCSSELHKRFDFFILEPLFFQLVLEVTPQFPHFREAITRIAAIRLEQWKSIINKAQHSGEIIAHIDREILARNFLSVSTSMVNVDLATPQLGISLKDMHRQFDQYYNLIKK
ncbi:MAG: TetR/AcrR family transcriptional regulator [Marinifilaceae bacterium]